MIDIIQKIEEVEPVKYNEWDNINIVDKFNDIITLKDYTVDIINHWEHIWLFKNGIDEPIYEADMAVSILRAVNGCMLFSQYKEYKRTHIKIIYEDSDIDEVNNIIEDMKSEWFKEFIKNKLIYIWIQEFLLQGVFSKILLEK